MEGQCCLFCILLSHSYLKHFWRWTPFVLLHSPLSAIKTRSVTAEEYSSPHNRQLMRSPTSPVSSLLCPLPSETLEGRTDISWQGLPVKPNFSPSIWFKDSECDYIYILILLARSVCKNRIRISLQDSCRTNQRIIYVLWWGQRSLYSDRLRAVLPRDWSSNSCRVKNFKFSIVSRPALGPT